MTGGRSASGVEYYSIGEKRTGTQENSIGRGAYQLRNLWADEPRQTIVILMWVGNDNCQQGVVRFLESCQGGQQGFDIVGHISIEWQANVQHNTFACGLNLNLCAVDLLGSSVNTNFHRWIEFIKSDWKLRNI